MNDMGEQIEAINARIKRLDKFMAAVFIIGALVVACARVSRALSDRPEETPAHVESPAER